ncbi:MAG: phosphoribosyltransferase family protein [Patescibacteria group bacterium]|jgi:orotate phosphoribosyltransferase
MNQKEVLQILAKLGAVITDSHIVYAAGNHGTAYVNKDAVYPDTVETKALCQAMAEMFADSGAEVVVGPEKGGIILSQWTAYHLTNLTGKMVAAVYAEREERSVLKATVGTPFFVERLGNFNLYPGEELLVREPKFIFKRGYGQQVAGKKVLVVEDVLTTGGSAAKTVEAVRLAGGKVVGLGVLCNRGGVTSDMVGNTRLQALVNLTLESWPEVECPLCAKNVPINIEVGKGKAFLARMGQA